MPGHDIGVMLHDREHDLVALADMGEADRTTATRLIASVAPRVKTISSIEPALRKARTFSRARLIGVGRGVGEIMQPAMDIGIFVLIGVDHALDHRARLLRRGRIVEIDQRLAIGPLGQDREIRADPLDVEGGRFSPDWFMRSLPRRAGARDRRLSRSRKSSSSMMSKASAAKASISIACACARGMPRDSM